MVGSARPLPPVGLLREAVALLWRCRGPLLVYGIASQIVVGLLLAPALFWVLAELLALLRSDVVLNYELKSLALSPTGLVLGLVWALVVTVLGVLALGGPCAVLGVGRAGGRPSLRAVLRHVIGRLPALPGMGAVKLSAWLVLLAPTAVAAATALAWLLFSPLGGGPARRWIPKEVAELAWIVPVVVALGAVAFLFYVRWAVALPCLVLERARLGDAMRRSVRLVRPRLAAVARVLAVHLLAGAVVVVVVTVLAGALGRGLLALPDPDGSVFSWMVALCLVLQGALLALVSIFLVSHGMAMAVLLHGSLADTSPDLSFLEASTAPRAPRARRIAIALVVLLAGATGRTIPEVKGELDRMREEIEVTAHRGASAEAPENTLTAIERAIAIGAHRVELDFQQCADGAIVLLHDESLARTAGVDRRVWEMTLPELRELDVGAWFDARFAGERIATLEEVLAAARGRITLNIELKTHGRETDFVPRVVAAIRDAGMTDACVITSLDLAALAQVRKAAPELRIGAILSASVGRIERLDVDFYSVQPNYASVAFVAKAHAQGRKVHVWTLNTADDLLRYFDRAVDNVITDEPALALRLLAERGPGDELRAAVLRLFRE